MIEFSDLVFFVFCGIPKSNFLYLSLSADLTGKLSNSGALASCDILFSDPREVILS